MVEVVGFRRCEGKSKSTGKSYAGYIAFYEEDRMGVTGRAAESVFLSDDLLEGRSLAVGQLMDLRYGRGGYLQSVEFA